MANTNGQCADTLIRELEANGCHYELFAALRLLQCAYPDRPPIGASSRPSEDPVRFGQPPSLAFAPTSIRDFKRGRDGGAHRLDQFAFGLFGPNGPLPLHFTEFARERQMNRGDGTFAAFLDLFHHRLLSLFFRAWSEHQPAAQGDRGDKDRFAFHIACLLGLGTESLRNGDTVPDASKLYYAGRLIGPVRNAEGLRAIVAQEWGMPTAIEEFVVQRLVVPSENRWRLGASPATGTLGESALVGESVLECGQKFRLRLGPMDAEDYEDLLPGRAGCARLRDWIRNYAGDALQWEAQLILKRDAAPRMELGRRGQLGWTSWIRAEKETRDRADIAVRSQ